MPSRAGSVTALIKKLSGGDRTVVDSLWSRFWSRLTRQARRNVIKNEIADADEEDLAQCVFHDVIQRISERRIANVENRRRLWRLLEVATFHAAVDMRRHELAGKRSSPEPGGLLSATTATSNDPPAGFFVSLEDDLEKLSQSVDLRAKTIVMMVLHGYAIHEIADRLQVTPRTVQRKLVQIREAWEEMNQESEQGSLKV